MTIPDPMEDLLRQIAEIARQGTDVAAGRALAEQALRRAIALQRSAAQAEACYYLCFFEYRMGAMQSLLQRGPQSLEMLRREHHTSRRAELLRWLTLSACDSGRFDLALKYAHEASVLADNSGDPAQRALTITGLAACFERMGDPWQAMRLLNQALELVAPAGSLHERFVVHNSMAATLIGAFYLQRGGDNQDESDARASIETARGWAQQAVAFAEQLTEPIYSVIAQGNLGEILVHLGELDEAARLLYGALELGLKHGYTAPSWRMRCSIGELLIEQNLPEQARVSLEGLLVDLQPGDPRATLIRVRHGLYRACRELGRHEEALRHLERCQQMERHRTTQQLKAQSELFVTRFEAEQSRQLAERARLDAQAQRTRAAEFEAHALRDQLTGLGNRRHLDRELPVVLEAANDLSLPVTLALIDVDHFKLVNDQFGHAVGDQVLVALAQMLREKTRASDLLARIGGEEFLVALPDTAPERAAEVCERLRLAVQNYEWDQLAGGLAVTLSVGVAHAPPYSSQVLFERADAAMYRAKQGGRNRVAQA